MALLGLAAGEEIECGFVASGAGSSTTAGRRSTYVRAALSDGVSVAAGSVAADFLPIPSPITSGWFSCEYYRATSTTHGSVTLPTIGLGKSDIPVGGLFIGQSGTVTNTTPKFAIFKVTSAGVITELATQTGASFALDTLHRLDVHFTGFNSGSGTVDLFLNGSTLPILAYAGSLTVSGYTTLDCARMIGTLQFGDGIGNAVSEILIASEDTRTFLGVSSLAPSGAGDTNTFTTGAYTDIDEIVLDDADMLTSDTAAQVFNCALTDLLAGTFAIRGVQVTVRAAKGSSGPSTLGIGIKTGGTANTANQALDTALLNYKRLMLTNPVTSNAFTVTEVNALLADLISVT